MRKLALLLFSLGALWGFDFQAGLDAYKRGDFATALKEWQPIAEKGDPNSQYNLGLLYARGEGVPQDYARALSWYQKAAEQGVAAAQYNLGVMYANGQGVPPNNEEARKWFLKAAEQGVQRAVTGLGEIYAENDGHFQNYAEAEKWYRKAAEEGVASAAFSLGVMYDVGQGVPQNYPEALKWYHQAADQGYASAMTNLGILYYNAQGVKRDLPEAYAWFARAQKRGEPRAADLMNVVANKLKPGDLKKAQAQVDQWQPASPPPVETADAHLFAPPPPQPAAAASAERSAPPAPGGQPAPAVDSDRVIAIGDVHGDYEEFVNVLASAGLIDGNGDWIGGKAQLVQTGDVVDRGPDAKAVMDLLMKLEKQAAKAGGGVHCLIGNHEAMDVYGDWRYVSPGQFATFATGDTGTTRDQSYQQYRKAITDVAKPNLDRATWEKEHPPGFAEMQTAFSAQGAYGRWIRSHDAAVKIGRTLFLHAGLGPKYADWTVERINNQVRRELNDLTLLHGGIVTDEEGPLWTPVLAKGDEAQYASLVDQLLKHFDVDRIVIGHTYADAAITPRFQGKVIMVDVGISRVYDNVGKIACLDIEKGQPYALHRGQKLELPKDESGPDMLRYLKQASALDPKPSPLDARIQKLEKQ